MTKDATIMPFLLGNASAQEHASIYAALVAGLTNTTLRPIVARELPFGEAAQAHREVMASKARGKIVLVP